MKYSQIKLCLLASFALSSMVIATRSQAQGKVSVFLHSPPPSRMNIEMLWNVDLINSGNPRLVYLYGVAKETKSGKWIADGTTNKFNIIKGKTSVSKAAIAPIDYHSDPAYSDIVSRIGKVPSGNYTICTYVLDAKTRDTLGRDCIVQHFISKDKATNDREK